MSETYPVVKYQQQDVMSASPMKLILMAYDVAITACEQSNFGRATRTISVLRDVLDSDYAGTAVGLLRLYQWCLDCIYKGDYNSAVTTLGELHLAWGKVGQGEAPLFEQQVARPLKPSAFPG